MCAHIPIGRADKKKPPLTLLVLLTKKIAEMSSYIIEKEDYIKFAGLLVGLEETKKSPYTYYLKSIRYKCSTENWGKIDI